MEENKSKNNKSIFRGFRMPYDVDSFIKICQKEIGTTSYNKTGILLLRELEYLIVTDPESEIINRLKERKDEHR